MKLTRDTYVRTGIFGVLTNEDGSLKLQTLEYAIPTKENSVSTDTVYLPKIPSGRYLCVRGEYILNGMIKPFSTFEIKGVPGHSGLLFHVGNTMIDTHGCVLLGQTREQDTEILQSRIAFDAFMNSLEGIDSFNLEVN